MARHPDQQMTPEQIANEDAHYRFARVKPFDRAKGHVALNRNIGGVVFKGGKDPEWKRVTLDQAEVLAEMHQIDDKPTSPKVFDICTYSEMKRLDMLERKKKLGVASRSEVSELTGEPAYGDATPPSKGPVSFSGVKNVDPSHLEPRGVAVREGSGDLSHEEVSKGQTRPGPQKSQHPNRKGASTTARR